MKKIFYLLILLFVNTSCNLSPGSYAYAEIYEFDLNEEKLIEAVEKFKLQNLSFCVPEQVELVDGKSNSKIDHWYHVWFYYQKENQIVYTWIRGNKIALVSINNGLELGNWKQINKDFTTKENKAQKKKFERLILNNVKKNLEQTRSLDLV